jgi:predicted NUDIX family NTP pyrophosphohydrolase
MEKRVTRQSAGIVLHRTRNETIEVFLVHPGGPLWKNKDAGAWSIPKGEFAEGEDALAAARREFEEETGTSIDGHFVALAPIRQRGGKVVHAWAVEGDIELAQLASNTFTIEWPPRSGKMQSFAEVDRYAWLPLDEARSRINEAQRALLDELASLR